MNIKSVCAPNCPDRTAECKLTCEKFLLYDRERLENAAKAQKEYNTKNAIASYFFDSYSKHIREKGARIKRGHV